MSKYTTELRFICEELSGLDKSAGQLSVNNIINNSWNKIFDFDFPIFDETYKPVLCKKIIKHYYTREIGFETYGLWKLKLETLLNEIMPYYNKLYNSELLEWNPLYDADYTKSHEGEGSSSGTDLGGHRGTITDNGNSTSTTNDQGATINSGTAWDVYSDTPQGALTNVENETYLTNARKVTNNNRSDTTDQRRTNSSGTNMRTFNDNTTRETDLSTTNEYVEHVVGKFPGKSYATLIKEFRETLLNIDVDVIADLSDLFLKLW